MVTDFDDIDDVHPLDYTAEDRVLAVEEWRWRKTYIELAATRLAIGIDLIATPGHRQSAANVLFGRTELRRQFVAGPAGAVACRVTALDDETGLDSMERQLVVKAILGELFE